MEESVSGPFKGDRIGIVLLFKPWVMQEAVSIRTLFSCIVKGRREDIAGAAQSGDGGDGLEILASVHKRGFFSG